MSGSRTRGGSRWSFALPMGAALLVLVAMLLAGGGALAYRVEGGPCTIDGALLTAGAAGECLIVASQAGDATWAAAPDKQRTVVVVPRPQTITFPKPSRITLGDPPQPLGASASSGLPVAYRVEAGPCTIDGDLFTAGAAGECLIVASQAGDATWAAAPDKQRTVVVVVRR